MATLQELIKSEIADFFAGFGSPGEPETPEDMQSQLLARIAPLLAGMEQEPVAYIANYESGAIHGTCDRDDPVKVEWLKRGMVVSPLYAAPQLPQPAVVEELLSLAEKLVNRYVLNKDSECEFIACITPSRSTIGMGGVWDEWKSLDAELKACRAAMLQGAEPVSQPYTLRDGLVAVPVEPTEDMIIAGFEAELREEFRDPEAWEAFEAMSGCEQAALRAKWCWAAMIAAAPQQEAE